MPLVPFTQFRRPHGTTKETEVDVPLEVALLAQRFMAEGGSYTSERLGHSNDVSLCAVFPIDNEPQDVVCVVCKNVGPEVTAAVEQLIRESFDVLQKLELRDA